ncbi:MAG: hypothetical protein ACHQJ6_01575 [Candidatus Berkiellales bacterium]
MWIEWIADIVGAIGASLVLIAYYLLEAEKLHAESKLYPLLNSIGALFLLYSLFFNWNLPAVLMEVAWLAISLWGYIKAHRRNASFK